MAASYRVRSFLSTLSLRRATLHTVYKLRLCIISIHALLAESDMPGQGQHALQRDFYPRSPCGERPLIPACQYKTWCYFYPRSPCGERLGIHRLYGAHHRFLSTLSLRRATFKTFSKINSVTAFLSTLSLRRATFAKSISVPGFCNFYPRSPCGERLVKAIEEGKATPISIHALLAESDVAKPVPRTKSVVFLSTLSLRRATNRFQGFGGSRNISIHALLAESDSARDSLRYTRVISIHALLAESDVMVCRQIILFDLFLSTLSLRRATAATACLAAWIEYFYPRSPCGERPVRTHCLPPHAQFLSTLSLRRATLPHGCGGSAVSFLSTLSLRRATNTCGGLVDHVIISIHALLAESDRTLPALPLPIEISIHALLAESDLDGNTHCAALRISIHALLAESDFAA